jgi:hypothetical protein
VLSVLVDQQKLAISAARGGLARWKAKSVCVCVCVGGGGGVHARKIRSSGKGTVQAG